MVSLKVDGRVIGEVREMNISSTGEISADVQIIGTDAVVTMRVGVDLEARLSSIEAELVAHDARLVAGGL